ncbi:tripartite motif-containing protein 2-like [Ptychodera flava]|uniref:tripartite motif-containing protein 2-like n=1 Tax=Ptychodera flava TaxID=63121 RepID=UPI00396A6807
MATASEVKFLEEVGEDLLCCTICLEKFKSPKTLPCLHTYCEQCLVILVEKTGSRNMLHCPECRQQYQLPAGGVPALKGNFFMSNLIEIFNRRLESMREAEIDCEGCQENTATHRSHVHRDLKDAADEYLTELKAMVIKLKVKEQDAEKSKTLAKQIHGDLKQQCHREERKVKIKAQGIVEKIKREEQRLIEEMKNNYKIKIKRAAADIHDTELKYCTITSACSYIETLMHHGNAAQLLLGKADARNLIKKLITMETDLQMNYEEVAFKQTFAFSENGILGYLVSDVDISKCSIENIPKRLVKGDSADLLITTRDSTGNKVFPKQQLKAKVRKPDGSCEDVSACCNTEGTHRVKVYAQMNGKYEVTITIAGNPLPGCPVIIPVIKGLVKTIGRKGSGRGQCKGPIAVAINGDKDIVCADRDNFRLKIVTKEGICKKILEFKQFKKSFLPFDIAISDDNTYYTLDNNNKQVVVSDENGHVIRTFGNHELKDPIGLGISPSNGNVYVTDFGEHCVKIYTRSGKYLRSFGSKGKGEGEFGLPVGVKVGNNGMVFVADYVTKLVQVFSSDDQYLYFFASECGNGMLGCPRKIAIEDDKYVYLTMSNPSCLVKFDIGGKFVRCIESDRRGLKYPTGLALTDDVPCRVIVADTNNHCIKVFVQ